MITSTQLRETLESLGGTVDKVRETLSEQGIKGSHSAYGCPVARYLTAELNLPALFPAAVCSRYTKVGGTAVSDNPAPVRRFIQLFDAGQFPEFNLPIPESVW